jgi:hypothetical protein
MRYVTSYGNMNMYGGRQPLTQYSFLNILDSGTCTMSGGTCGAQSLASHTDATAPKCFVTLTGTTGLGGRSSARRPPSR